MSSCEREAEARRRRRKDDDPTGRTTDEGVDGRPAPRAPLACRGRWTCPPSADARLLDRFETPRRPAPVPAHGGPATATSRPRSGNEGGQPVQAAPVTLRECQGPCGDAPGSIRRLRWRSEFTRGWRDDAQRGDHPRTGGTAFPDHRATSSGTADHPSLPISARTAATEPIELVIEDRRTEPLNDQIKVTV